MGFNKTHPAVSLTKNSGISRIKFNNNYIQGDAPRMPILICFFKNVVFKI